MDSSVRRLLGVIRAWLGTQDLLGEYPVVSIGVGHPGDELVKLDAYETPPLELAALLEQDIAARCGINPDWADAYSSLVYSALRIRHLSASPPWRLTSHQGLGAPQEAAEALFLLSELARTTGALSAEISGMVAAALTDGSVVPNVVGPGDAQPVRGLDPKPSSSLAESLRAELLQLAGVTAGMREDVANLEEAEPSLVPDKEFVLQTARNQGRATGRYHVRVLRRPSGHVTVLLGNLADNTAQSVTNGIERLVSVVATIALHPGEDRITDWIEYSPAPAFASSTRADEFAQIVFERSDDRALPSWRRIDAADLQRRLEGGVKRYTIRDYNSVALRRRGVTLVVSEEPR